MGLDWGGYLYISAFLTCQVIFILALRAEGRRGPDPAHWNNTNCTEVSSTVGTSDARYVAILSWIVCDCARFLALPWIYGALLWLTLRTALL